jgi:hypothetical protein
MPLAIHENPSFYRRNAGLDDRASLPLSERDFQQAAFWGSTTPFTRNRADPSVLSKILCANCDLFCREIQPVPPPSAAANLDLHNFRDRRWKPAQLAAGGCHAYHFAQACSGSTRKTTLPLGRRGR